MTDKFLDQYISSGAPTGYEQLRNVRVFGPFWSALLQATKSRDGSTTRFSLTSLGSQHESPQLAAVSAYAIRNDPFGLHSDTDVFVKGIGDNWLRNMQDVTNSDGDVVARRQHFDTEQQLILSPVTDWPEGDPSGRLPAFKLVEGAIPVDVTDRALGVLQSLLGGSQGNLATARRRIYLTPDGIAFPASVVLPTLGDADPLFLWLLLTQDVAEASQGTNGRPVLRPWLSAPSEVWPDEDQAGGEIGKSETKDQFAKAMGPFFVPGGVAAEDPKMFDLRLRRPLSLPDFQWPLALERRDSGRKTVVKSSGHEDAVIETRGDALSLRLSERSVSGSVPPKSSLLILPDHVTLERNSAEETVTLSGRTGAAPLPDDQAKMTYSYKRDVPAEASTRESVKFDALRLHVPLRATRQALFGAEDGRPDKTRRVYLPVQQGWVENDFPTLSVTELSELDPTDIEEEDPAAQTVGAMGIGNIENAASRFENVWNVTVRGADQVDVKLDFKKNGGVLERKVIDVALHGPRVASDGLLRIVAMEPSATRLLPDHPERALRARPIKAVDQSDLPQLERQVLGHVSVRLDNISLDMVLRRDAGGIEELMLKKAKFDYTVMHPDAAQSEPAIFWARHRALPTVQTQNLTQAGGDRRRPSGTRELAPLAIAGNTIRLEGEPADALRYAAGQLSSILDGFLPETQTQMRWNEQLGMAVTTLPSVTLMPLALKARESGRRKLDAWKTDANGWDSGISAEMRLRYDVALLDGPRANTELPDTEPETSNPAAAAAFETSVSKSSATRAQSHWQAQFSSDVLSAVAWREVLAQREDDQTELRLTGLGRGTFDLTPNVKLAPKLAPQAQALGSYSLALVDASGHTQEITFFGVPWSGASSAPGEHSDVSGLSLELQGKTFVGGSALLEPKDDVLEDQQGGRQSPARLVQEISVTQGKSVHLVERAVAGAALDAPLRLVSTVEPIDFGELSLWLSDLAVNEAGTWDRDPILGPIFGAVPNANAPSGARKMPNAHHPEHNVRVGHRWALRVDGEDQPSDLGIALRGVLFRPIALSRADINTSTGAAEFEIAGQIVLHVRSGSSEGDTPQTVPTAVGAAKLKIVRDGEGTPTVTLEADQLSIPVLDRHGSSAPISQLQLKEVKFEAGGMRFEGASLHVPMLGHLFTLDLSRDEAVQQQLTLKGEYQVGDNPSGLVPSSATVVLGTELASGVEQATATFVLGFGGANGPYLCARGLKYDLMQADSMQGGTQRVALMVPGLPKALRGTVGLTAAGVALTWRHEFTDIANSFRVLPGLSVRASRGWALGAFQAPSSGAEKLTSIALQDWQMDLRHWDTLPAEIQTELRLVASRSEPEPDWCVSGAWQVQNEIQFPLPDTTTQLSNPADETADLIEAQFEQGFATPIVHSATLYLVEHALSPVALNRLAGRDLSTGEGAVQLGMMVAHRLDQSGQEAIKWAQYQTVDIYDMAALRNRLAQIGAQEDDVVGWKNHEISGLFSKAHAPKLLAAVDGAARGIAFDFGALPCFGVPGAGFTLAQLPAFGVLEATLNVSEDLAKVLNRTLPLGAVMLSVPLVDGPIRFDGPSQEQLSRRAGLLAGASAQYSHPLAKGHAKFIEQQLSVAKLPQWSAWQLSDTQPYLAAGVGLSGLLSADSADRTALSLMPIRDEDVTSLQGLKSATAFFAALAEGRINTFAVALDSALAAPDPLPERSGRVRAVSGATGKLINPRPYDAQKDFLKEPDYRRFLLRTADPSASIGVILPPNDAAAPRLVSNQDVPSASRPVEVPGAQAGALATPERQRLAVTFKPGLIEKAPEIARRATRGLSMQSATPEVLAYPGPEDREDDDAATSEALMRATRRSLRASLADTTTFLSGKDAAAWLSEMSRPLFRAADDPGNDKAATILFNPAQDAPLPVAYDPVGGDILPPGVARLKRDDPNAEIGEHPDMYLPAGLTVSRISQAPGITYADRLGAAVFAPATAALSGRASSAPVFQRMPRPGQLGRKDQVRPSQFETGHVLLSTQPVNTLYGRGTAQPIGPDLPSPDADMAFRVWLTEPMHGVLTPDWARRIAVSFEPLSDSASKFSFGEMKASAVLVLGGAVHVLAQDAEDEPSKTKYFMAQEEATVALSTLEEVETARLVLTVTIGDFARRLSLDLWAVGDGVPHLAERPLYFLFEDPTLDELTRGVSHFAARSTEPDEVITGQPALSLRIATETQKITPTDSFTLIFGAINPETNLEVREDLTGTSWSMKRVRPIPGQTEPPKPEDMKPMLLPAKLEHTPPEIGKIVLGKPVEIDLTTDFIAGALQPGDTVQIEWTLNERRDPFSFLLYIQVVATAPPSSNPASYAVLQAELAGTRSAERCRCVLHQESADPTDRELVDSARLLQGTAIFRSRFRWRAFLASGSAASEAALRWAVQKIDGQGSTWLPADMVTDWAMLKAVQTADEGE